MNWNWLITMLYPRRCVMCGDVLPYGQGQPTCSRCHIEPYRITDPRCRICSRPVSEVGSRCTSCLMHENRIPGVGVFRYEGTIRDMIHQFKYEGQRSLGKDMAQLMISGGVRIPKNVTLIPIPIHTSRRAARGYNQAEILAVELGKHFGVVVDTGLKRNRATAPQNNLTSFGRRQNLKGCFSYEGSGIQPEELWIVDDIFTSGSTIEEAASVLEKRFPEVPIRFLTFSLKI